MKTAITRDVLGLAISWLACAMVVSAQPLTLGPTLSPGLDNAGACSDGVVYDDSTVETGYGWIPSVSDGRYAQLYRADDFPNGTIDSICICWLRTRLDEDIDFEIVLYEADERRKQPAPAPRFRVPASALGVPMGVTGRFYEYKLPGGGFVIPERDFFLGVHWDASADTFFFLCGDLGGMRRPVPTFFTFNSGKTWISALQTTDPIFDDYKSLLIRPVPGKSELHPSKRER